MADYNSTYTGAEVDASVAKSQAIPAATDLTSIVDMLKENSATAGDVLTADGSGGASWEAGGAGLYQTQFEIKTSSSAIMGLVLTTKPIRTTSTHTASEVISAFETQSLFVSGAYVDISASARMPIYYMYAGSSSVSVNYPLVNGSSNIALINASAITSCYMGVSTVLKP